MATIFDGTFGCGFLCTIHLSFAVVLFNPVDIANENQWHILDSDFDSTR